MLTSMKQASIAVAVTFGVALCMPLSPALSASSPSNTVVSNPAASPLRSGDLVRLRSGGPLMTVIGIDGDDVKCVWTDWNGQIASDNFPADVLQVE